jgi:hypothetical protein|tara:strand:+ start:13774 stop:13950 length:177 start_codon:yes stop_codon:yes gene_type:complete
MSENPCRNCSGVPSDKPDEDHDDRCVEDGRCGFDGGLPLIQSKNRSTTQRLGGTAEPI